MGKRTRPSASFACAACRKAGEGTVRLQVKGTEKVGAGVFIAIRRRRECPNCGARTSYFELPAGAGPRAVAARFPRVARTLNLMGKLTAAVRGLADGEG